jgi:hypothetical protein
LKLLWSFSDTPLDDDKLKALISSSDDTIEAPSETAMKARQAVKDGQAENVAQEVVEHVEAEEVEDDSWMDGPVGSSNSGDPKLRKRKAGKKK